MPKTKPLATMGRPIDLESHDYKLLPTPDGIQWKHICRDPPQKNTKDKSKHDKGKYVRQKEFLSRKLLFHYRHLDKKESTKLANYDRDTLTKKGKIVASKLVEGKFLEDNAKAPINNGPKSAMMSIQALNAFFSANIGKNADGTVDRRSYGYLTAFTTGLDQRRCKVHVFFDEMTDMVNVLQSALLRAGYNLKDENGKLLRIDMITVKAYYRYYDIKEKKWVSKILNPHTDVKYQPSGKADADNNQHGGSPVVIYNLGDPKILKFELIDWYTKKPIPGEGFEIRQPTNHCFVLDAEDEVPKLRGKLKGTKYLSYWAHSSRLEDPINGVSISIQFRFGNRNTPVHVLPPKVTADGIERHERDGCLAKTCQSARTDAKFDKAEGETWMCGEEYEAEKRRIYSVLEQRFVKK